VTGSAILASAEAAPLPPSLLPTLFPEVAIRSIMPSWLAPPTRRELLLSLISLTVFVCAFNADTALHRLGYSMRLYSPFSGVVAPTIGPDGRRPEAYRDALEDEIFGTWDWEPGRIAGVKPFTNAFETEGLLLK